VSRAAIVVIIVLVMVFAPIIYFTAYLAALAWAVATWVNSMAYIDAVLAAITVFVPIALGVCAYVKWRRGRVEGAIAFARSWSGFGSGLIEASTLSGSRRGSARTLVLLAIVLFIVFTAIGLAIHGTVVIPSSGALLAKHVTRIDHPINVVMARIVPLKTAYAYAISELQVPTHTIYMDESYIYYNGTVPIYNWIVEPEGLFNEWTRDAIGAVFVYGEYPPRVVFVQHDLVWSLHRARLGLVYWNLYYALKLAKPMYKPLFEDNIEVLIGGRIYILIPAETWVKTLTTSIPILAGYFVVDEEGHIRFVPAEKLMSDPITRRAFTEYSIPIVPEVIAREWIELMRWAPGWMSVVFYHQTYEIRDVGTNPQPYLVFDERHRLWWLFAVEPAGKSYAIRYLMYVNTSSIEPRIVLYKPRRTWMGASKIFEYVMKAHPTFDWSQFSIEEPIPLVINGTLFWKVTIVTKDGRGIVCIDLVNAETGDVYSMPVKNRVTVADFYSFIDREILHRYVAPTALNVSGGSIVERIEQLKKRIEEMQKILQEMYRELEQLEEALNRSRR